MAILEHINNPQDLKNHTREELRLLAEEIRQTLITHVPETGGHLASNLGVVELTIALHVSLDSPRDKIIWDVGHQSYVHKLLTGRREAFSGLRTYGGISGFPKRSESEHDIFETGHSSTALSAALGIARARDLQGDDYQVAAVVGDGAFGGGMVYEAMNDAGHSGTRLMLILNDNEMSISKNVGALSAYLAQMRTGARYRLIKARVKRILRRVPGIGRPLAASIERVKEGVRQMLVPGAFFEAMGFTYIGPVDGHNLAQLLGVLRYARRINGPVLIHMVTCKGKGFEAAESAPSQYHGMSPRRKTSDELTYTNAFSQKLIELARKDEKIVAITAGMEEGTGLGAFHQMFPQRFFDVGIAEEHAVTMAAGMACAGLKPVVAVYSTFLQRGYDQLLHDVCLQRLPVIFAIDRAGVVGEDGETHQGIFDLSFLRTLPKMRIWAPKCPAQLCQLLEKAFSDTQGPVAIRYPRGGAICCTCGGCDENAMTSDSWEVLRKGENGAIFAAGRMVPVACAVGERLGWSVVNAWRIAPLDLQCLVAFSAGFVVTLEENIITGGLGGAVAEVMMGECAKLLTLGVETPWVAQGETEMLLRDLGLDEAGVMKRICEWMEG